MMRKTRARTIGLRFERGAQPFGVMSMAMDVIMVGVIEVMLGVVVVVMLECVVVA